MQALLGLARRQVTLQQALPWVLAISLTPFWFLFPSKFAEQLWNIFSHATGIQTAGTDGIYFLHDFQPFWAAGKLIRLGASRTIYHSAAFWAWRRDHWSSKSPWMLQYFYPPTGLALPILISPFSRLTGFMIWQLINLLPSILLLRKLQRPWLFIGLCLISPALMFNTWIAQIGVLTGTIFIAGLMGLEDRTIRPGLLLGILAIKPQAGLLGPVVLLARGRYGAIVAGGALVLALSVAVSLVCGWPIWNDYLTHGSATARIMLFAPFSSHLQVSGVSVFWMARSFGASVNNALLFQAVSAAIAIFCCWTAWRRPRSDHVALVALTVALTLFVTPYGYTTDMCGLTIMTVWLAWDRRGLEIADVLILVWPAICQMVSVSIHLELTPLILLLGALRAWKRLAGIGTPAPACYPAPL